ncbi:MAG: hypothetical protein KC517_11295 [Bacteroidetes bacterium]|jgi:hypothetical protein|nr:hypothetical protein [Bacteroidota bacterium]
MLISIFAIILGILTVLMCIQESAKRKISFSVALLYCMALTPILGYIIILHRPLRNPLSCESCGSELNEASYCQTCESQKSGVLNTHVDKHLAD